MASDGRPRLPPKTRLPSRRRSFVGRSAQLTQLARLFEEDEAQLVTIAGPGGVGKTSLALRYAGDRATAARDGGLGVAFCDLSEAANVSDLCAAVVGALDAPADAAARASDPVVEVGSMLGARGPLLVVLDNFEQIVELAERALDEWCSAAPEAQFLVTSRERLRLEGEIVCELGPLTLPPATGRGSSEAAELFIDRVRELRPDYEPESEREDIARLVVALEGLPLAIELAAERASILGPREMHARLERRCETLGRARRGAPARHATLRAAIEWSWDLLEDAERAALAECSVFRGTFTLEDAEAVVEAADGRSVLDLVQSLREKSLLRAEQETAGAPQRFAMLLSIRELAAEQLVALDRRDHAVKRHADYYENIAASLGEAAQGRDAADARAELAVRLDNVLAAADRALDADTDDEVARALRILVALDPLAGTHGYVGAHVERLTNALDRAQGRHLDRTLVARALESRGRCALVSGGVDTREADLRGAAAIARETGDLELESRAVASLGRLLVDAGRIDDGIEACERALALARTQRLPRIEALAHHHLGIGHHRGRYGEAVAHADRARRLYAELADPRGEADALTALALAELQSANVKKARAAAEAALELSREAVAPNAEGLALELLGACEHASRNAAGAIPLYEEAVRVAQSVGDRRVEASANAYLGLALFDTGSLAAARWQIDDARRQLRAVGMTDYACQFDAIEASFAADTGDFELAERLLAGAEAEVASAVNSGMRAAVDLCRGHAELSRADASDAEGSEATRLRDSARDRLRRAQTGSAGEPPPVVRSLEAFQLASRLARRLDGSQAAPSGVHTAPKLSIGRDARWFQPSAEAPVALAHRPLLRRLLGALAHARLEQPGRALSVDSLVEAGWPDERMIPASKKNRLKVAISRLRDLGLRGLLVSSPDGYLIALEVSVELVDSSTPPPPST